MRRLCCLLFLLYLHDYVTHFRNQNTSIGSERDRVIQWFLVTSCKFVFIARRLYSEFFYFKRHLCCYLRLFYTLESHTARVNLKLIKYKGMRSIWKLCKVNFCFLLKKCLQLWGHYVPNFRGLSALDPPPPPKIGGKGGPNLFFFFHCLFSLSIHLFIYYIAIFQFY